MKNEREMSEKYEIEKINELEGYEKINSDLTTIVDNDDLNKGIEKYQRINLSHNKLTQIKELFIFTKLVYLDLSYNQFEKLANFFPLKELEVLILSNNFLRDIGTYLFPLKKLQHLDLSNNVIDMNNNAIISALKENEELISLLLIGNHNYNYENAKYLCLSNLKKITFLDAIKIVNDKKNEKNKNIKRAYINVKGIKGNQKKISTLNEYINFKFNDYKNNKNDYDNNMKSNQQKDDDNIKVLNNKVKSSYYFLKYSSSC